MTTRRGYKRPTTTKPVAPAKVFAAPIGKNSPNVVIRMGSGVTMPKPKAVRPIRRRGR